MRHLTRHSPLSIFELKLKDIDDLRFGDYVVTLLDCVIEPEGK